MPRLLVLRIWHPGCWAIDLTEEVSGLRVEAAAMYRSEPYNVADEMVYGEDAEVAAFETWASRDPRILQHHLVEPPSPSHPARYLTRYRLPTSLLDLLFAHQLVPLEPMWVRGGYDYCKVVVPHDGGVALFLEDAGRRDYEVAALAAHRVERDERMADGRVGEEGLTPRQLEVAQRALELGYYSWPREVSGKELAQRMGVSAPTVLEHLRKFESRVVRAYLRRDRGEGTGREETAVRRRE